MAYEVSYLSTNKIKIALTDSSEKEKKNAKQLKALGQLCSYGLEFIRYWNTDNQSTTIYLAESAVLTLAKRVLGRSTEYDQLLRYETYQKMEGYFLSILTILNVELEDAPAFPIAFLVHENNDERSHLDFWTKFVIQHFDYPVPITVGEDPCIMAAVLKCLHDSKGSRLFFCSNKIVQDVNRFCRNRTDANQPIKYKSPDYKEEPFFTGIENLVASEAFSKFEETVEEFQSEWSPNYLAYFSEKISPLIVSNLKRNKTTNLRINTPEKKKYALECSLTDSEKFCLTDLILRLYRRSAELVIEFNRLYSSNSKPYKVKYKFISLLKTMPIVSKYVDYLDETKKRNNSSCLTLFKPSIYMLFHFQIADLVINNGLIYFDEPTNSYMVRSPFNETMKSVYDDNGKTQCTCSLPDVCFHKIAAKFVSEMQPHV